MAVHYSIRGKQASAIAASIEAGIRDGHYSAGAKLPPVRALADRLAVSPATVASAYRNLRVRGLVTAQRRAGTCVTTRPPLPTRAALPVPAHARDLIDGNPDPALLPRLDTVLGRLETRRHLASERAPNPELLRVA